MTKVPLWIKVQAGNKTVYIKEPESTSSVLEARVTDISSSNAVVFNYQNGSWTNNNTLAVIPGGGGGPTVTLISIREIIVDIKDKVDSVKEQLLNSLGFVESEMTLDDWGMVGLGITTGVIDSTLPEGDTFYTLFVNKNTVKKLVLLIAGVNENDANNNYYYIKSKTYTEYTIMITANIIEYGSIGAASASLAAAGISFIGGLATFTGTGGLVDTVCTGY